MSHYPSNSPPPPYYGYQNQHSTPSVSSYTYVPTQMMMHVPVYYGHAQQPPPPQPIPVQPTYVTNYIYQQPAQPFVEDKIEWAPATEKTAATFKSSAFVASKLGADSPLWIIRAQHCGDLVPGKWSTRRSTAFIPHGGREIPVNSFEILLAEEHMVCWSPSKLGNIPARAIVAGSTCNGEPLYIGRAKHQFSMIPGKVHPSHKRCFITQRGVEIACKDYEVLCQIVI